jgi:hypothetical protein
MCLHHLALLSPYGPAYVWTMGEAIFAIVVSVIAGYIAGCWLTARRLRSDSWDPPRQ